MTASGMRRAEQRREQRRRGAAASPREHLPRRPEPLAEEEVRDERGGRADADARAQPERDAAVAARSRSRAARRESARAARGPRRRRRRASRYGDLLRGVAGRRRATSQRRRAARSRRAAARAPTRASRTRRRSRRHSATRQCARRLRKRLAPARARATTSRSATARANTRSCVTTSVARARACPRSSAASSALRSGSTPRVGSSSTSRSGSVDEHRGEREPLALAGREIARMAGLVARETDLGERTARARRIGAERDLVVRPLAHEIAARDPGAATSRGPCASTVPALRLEQPGGELGERRLPRAVRPGERDDLAAAQLERDAVEHRCRAVRERDVVDAAHDLAAGAGCRAAPRARRQAGRCSASQATASSRGASSSDAARRSRKTTRSA